MPDFDPLNKDGFAAESESSAYTTLFLLTGLALATYAMAKLAQSSNRLNYESNFARIIAGFLILMMNLLHTRSGDIELTNTENKLIAIGPHRTSWEAFVVASKIKGTPPRFFATDSFNAVPGVASFMKMFKAIPVEANAAKGDNGRSSNVCALDHASTTLSEKGCVALFPQGNFAKLGEDPPRIYSGAAKLALRNKVPIHVIRLDGFWCLQNVLIPQFIRNSAYYRAFLSGLHMNNVRTTLCCEIDFHLKPENEHLSDEEKTEEICAQLYAYYRHTQELTVEQIAAIKTEISEKTHLQIWSNKVKQDSLGKQLLNAKKEGAELGERTSTLMSMTSKSV
jgi:1-acyl-sn-glycerol-3-phosphate acyltransferase